MRAGPLNKVITLQEQQEVKDDYGSININYIDLKDIRASVAPISGDEKYINAELLNTVTHKITIRYDSNLNLDPTNRIVFKNRNFEIENVLNFQEKNVFYTILCKEKFNE